MDLKGTLKNTNLLIYPSQKLLNFIRTLKLSDQSTPINILKLNAYGIKTKNDSITRKADNIEFEDYEVSMLNLNNKDIENLNIIKQKIIKSKSWDSDGDNPECNLFEPLLNSSQSDTNAKVEQQEEAEKVVDLDKTEKNDPHLTTGDLDWLYLYIKKRRSDGEKTLPYLHELLEGSQIELPENEVIKRNPVLEARCVKLRAQQESREYRKMTRTVDNVRMKFPEDSIAYQLKQVNRQMIAIGQFILSIFAGFLFGFKGVEWMIGSLDFGFRLLLGVMCALIIALAEIYFLAKKLNEELNIPETVQLGGPVKLAEGVNNNFKSVNDKINKEHQD